jgi:UDP-glucose 4-epimerase
VLAVQALAKHTDLVCNLGSGSGFSVREIIEIARKVTGKNIRTVELPRRSGEAAVLIASAARAKQVLGWRPQQSDIETIVRSAWEWHRRG